MGRRLLLPLLLLLSLTGCTANMASYAEAIAKDPSNVCISVSTPYGTGLIGRANTPGVRLSISGGQCILETPK